MHYRQRRSWINAIGRSISLWAVALLLIGCAAHKLERRRSERQAAYAALLPEHKKLVDQQMIDVGFSTNAVYIAWGPPAHVVPGLDASIFTWLYRCTYAEERREWRPRQEYIVGGRGAVYSTMEYTTVFDARTYICGEVVFERDAVKLWRVFPRPDPPPFR